MEDLAAMRKEYSDQSLDEGDTPEAPLPLFKQWLEEAVKAQVIEPNAMCVATCGPDMMPSNRYVLLKAVDERGFVFYTNTESRKSQQIKANPKAAASFWWAPLERQVRIEGIVEENSAEESDKYFASRCRGAQIGAWTSLQSQPVANREAVAQKEAEMKQKFEGVENLERPPHWGGWRIKPL